MRGVPRRRRARGRTNRCRCAPHPAAARRTRCRAVRCRSPRSRRRAPRRSPATDGESQPDAASREPRGRRPSDRTGRTRVPSRRRRLPGPSSDTVTSTRRERSPGPTQRRPAFRRHVAARRERRDAHRDRPSKGENLSAFSSRLSNTCVSASTSPRTSSRAARLAHVSVTRGSPSFPPRGGRPIAGRADVTSTHLPLRAQRRPRCARDRAAW